MDSWHAPRGRIFFAVLQYWPCSWTAMWIYFDCSCGHIYFNSFSFLILDVCENLIHYVWLRRNLTCFLTTYLHLNAALLNTIKLMLKYLILIWQRTNIGWNDCSRCEGAVSCSDAIVWRGRFWKLKQVSWLLVKQFFCVMCSSTAHLWVTVRA